MNLTTTSYILKLGFYLFVILTIVRPVWSLKCWICSSNEGGLCGDPFNVTDMWQSDCPDERPPTPDPYYGTIYRHQPIRYPVCKKVKQKEHGKLVIIRSCGYESRKNASCDPDGYRSYSNDIQFCDTCTTDGCNSAPYIANFGLWLSISGALMIYSIF